VANHKQAIKRARQSKKRSARNAAVKTRVKRSVRAFHETAASGDKDAVEAALTKATREIQRAGSKGVLHKRAASRRVARLARAANRSAK
jgi:small subunit ribosomal protein S20